MAKVKKSETGVKNIVVISDTHFGCRFGLCPPKVKLEGGGIYKHSKLQNKTWRLWKSFWNEWVPKVTRGESYIIVHNGDIIDGVHHGSVTQISHNIEDQRNIAIQVMREVTSNPQCQGYYQIRGTEAHSGLSGQYEENIARELGAKGNGNSESSVYDLYLRFRNGKVVHFSHHIGVAASGFYEATAPYKELVNMFSEYGKCGKIPPDVIVRSHRHRYIKVEIERGENYGMVIITPSWQLFTPYMYKSIAGRTSFPQIGGVVIRCGDEDLIYTRAKVWNVIINEEYKNI